MQDLQSFLKYCNRYIREGNNRMFSGRSKIWHSDGYDYLELPFVGLQNGTYKQINGSSSTLSCSMMWGNSVEELIECLNEHYQLSMNIDNMLSGVKKLWEAFFHIIKLIKFNSGNNLRDSHIYFVYNRNSILPIGIRVSSFGIDTLQDKSSEGVCPNELIQYFSSLRLSDVICVDSKLLSNSWVEALNRVEYWGTSNILSMDNSVIHLEINLDTLSFTLWVKGLGWYNGITSGTYEAGRVSEIRGILLKYFGVPLLYKRIKIYVDIGRYFSCLTD